MPVPIILDVDTGVDDIAAVLAAAAKPDVDLIAIDERLRGLEEARA